VDQNHSEHQNSGYGLYVKTWLALLGLTAITVTVAGMHFGGLSVFVAVLVASIKASVVLSFFMHLKHERPVFRIMLYVCLVTYTIFIGLTFFDPLFRH
jgi:cytochrome c oxidase subunit 4